MLKGSPSQLLKRVAERIIQSRRGLRRTQQKQKRDDESVS